MVRQAQVVNEPAVLGAAAIGAHVEAEAQVALVFPGRKINRLLGPVGAHAGHAVEAGPVGAVGGDFQPAPVAVGQAVAVLEPQHRPARARQVHRRQRIRVTAVDIVAGGRVGQARAAVRSGGGRDAPGACGHPLVGAVERVAQGSDHRHGRGRAFVGGDVGVVGVHREHAVVIRRPDAQPGVGQTGDGRHLVKLPISVSLIVTVAWVAR